MGEPWIERVRKLVCRHFSHRPKYDGPNSNSVSCGRCRHLLAGPLQINDPNSKWFGFGNKGGHR